MGLVLILSTISMDYVVEKYNDDYLENIVADILVQILHIITLLFILFCFIASDISFFYKLFSIYTIDVLFHAILNLIANVKTIEFVTYEEDSEDEINDEQTNETEVIDDDKKER